MVNLLSKLRAIEGTQARPDDRKPRPEPGPPPACWEKQTYRPMDEFPHADLITAETLALMSDAVLPSSVDPRSILFLDTETTGLSGGAGTVAFEIGIGHLTDDGFTVRQLVMRDYGEEGPMLRRLIGLAEPFDILCTFNGSTFDLPLLRSRFIMNRIRSDVLDKPHIDLLHMARRLWKLRLGRCNLTRLEEVILGRPRSDDLPGSEAPERYFKYLRTRDFSLLQGVLEHNEQDIASLCTLLGRMAWLYRHPEAIGHAADTLAMGKALELLRHPEEARRCYRLIPSGRYHVEGQLRLAQSWRRSGERGEAVKVWQDMIARREGGIEPYVALAKHEEHIVGDLREALRLTEQAMMLLAEPTLFESEAVQADQNALQYRYDRLKRKLAVQQAKEMKI